MEGPLGSFVWVRQPIKEKKKHKILTSFKLLKKLALCHILPMMDEGILKGMLGFVSLLKGISTFVGYLMPKRSL